MNNKIPCAIIKDLLPSYIDEVCGSESSMLIEEHLHECGECENEYKQMLSGYEKNNKNPDVKEKIIYKVSKRIKKRIIIITLSAVAATAAVFSGIYIGTEIPLKKLKFENAEFWTETEEINESNYKQTEDGGVLAFSMDNMASCCSIDNEFNIGDKVIKLRGKFNSTIRQVNSDWQTTEYGNTIILTAKTTLFNNKPIQLTEITTGDYFDFWEESEVDCIMYDDGDRHILWKK